jgi:predicted phage terminase large subunit-like protein
MNSLLPSPQDAALEVLNRRKARQFLADFAKFVKPGYLTAKHIDVLCEWLQAFALRETDRLRIDCPPRHSKSTHVSELLPAYLLGLYPGAKVMSATHTAALAHEMCAAVQKIMDTAEYLALFPNSRIGNVRQADRFSTISGGKYQSFGVKESISGYGFDFGLVDDVYPGRKQAESAAYRREVQDWYEGSFERRADTQEASILLTTTRWHKEDLSARVVQEEGWTVLTLPAICTNPNALGEFRKLGEPLWPERFSLEHLRALEAKNIYEFSTQYQQDPKQRTEGSMFKASYFEQRLSEMPVLDEWVRWWDVAYGVSDAADRTASALVSRIKEGRFAGKWVLADMHFGRWSSHERNCYMRNVAEQDMALVTRDGKQFGKVHGFFEKGFGAGMPMNQSVMDALNGYSMRPIKVKDSKAYRADPFAAQCEAGNVVLVEGPWIPHFIQEACEFDPVSNTHEHDDLVDAPVGAYHMALRLGM